MRIIAVIKPGYSALDAADDLKAAGYVIERDEQDKERILNFYGMVCLENCENIQGIKTIEGISFVVRQFERSAVEV